jgi:hypothetical protein
MTTVRMTQVSGENCEELTVTSAYLLYELDEPQPTRKLRDVINYCKAGKGNSSFNVMQMYTSHHMGEHWHQSKKRRYSIW